MYKILRINDRLFWKEDGIGYLWPTEEPVYETEIELIGEPYRVQGFIQEGLFEPSTLPHYLFYHRAYIQLGLLKYKGIVIYNSRMDEYLQMRKWKRLFRICQDGIQTIKRSRRMVTYRHSKVAPPEPHNMNELLSPNGRIRYKLDEYYDREL